MGKLTKQHQLYLAESIFFSVMETERSSSKHHVLKNVGTALCRSREIMHGNCCFEHFLKILFFEKGRRIKIIHCLVPDHWFLSCLRRAGHELGTVRGHEDKRDAHLHSDDLPMSTFLLLLLIIIILSNFFWLN